MKAMTAPRTNFLKNASIGAAGVGVIGGLGIGTSLLLKHRISKGSPSPPDTPSPVRQSYRRQPDTQRSGGWPRSPPVPSRPASPFAGLLSRSQSAPLLLSTHEQSENESAHPRASSGHDISPSLLRDSLLQLGGHNATEYYASDDAPSSPYPHSRSGSVSPDTRAITDVDNYAVDRAIEYALDDVRSSSPKNHSRSGSVSPSSSTEFLPQGERSSDISPSLLKGLLRLGGHNATEYASDDAPSSPSPQAVAQNTSSAQPPTTPPSPLRHPRTHVSPSLLRDGLLQPEGHSATEYALDDARSSPSPRTHESNFLYDKWAPLADPHPQDASQEPPLCTYYFKFGDHTCEHNNSGSCDTQNGGRIMSNLIIQMFSEKYQTLQEIIHDYTGTARIRIVIREEVSVDQQATLATLYTVTIQRTEDFMRFIGSQPLNAFPPDGRGGVGQKSFKGKTVDLEQNDDGVDIHGNFIIDFGISANKVPGNNSYTKLHRLQLRNRGSMVRGKVPSAAHR